MYISTICEIYNIYTLVDAHFNTAYVLTCILPFFVLYDKLSCSKSDKHISVDSSRLLSIPVKTSTQVPEIKISLKTLHIKCLYPIYIYVLVQICSMFGINESHSLVSCHNLYILFSQDNSEVNTSLFTLRI